MPILSRHPFALISCLLLCLSCAASCRADDPTPPVSGHLSLYINGTLQGSADCPSAWKATGHTQLGHGLFDGKPVDFVTGLLGDVRVYDRALPAAQIKALSAQGPQTQWHLDHTANAAQGQADQNGPLELTGTDTPADAGRSLLDTTHSYTVSAWVFLKNTDGFQTFVSQDGKSLSGFYLQKRGDDGKFAFSIRDSDGPNPPQVIAESSLAPKVNTLYHVVGVFSVGPIAASASPPAPAAPILTASLPWDADHQGRFLESLAQDRQGHTWVATEDNGVWRFDPASPAGQRWTQFTTKDGLGNDDVYALLVDQQNRLWAGTLHGVSVYDGKTWKTYGPLEGLGGFRVFALASCPTSGDVWIATEGGLTRYLAKTGRWQQYSRLDGLPSDAVQCLAFSKTGDLYVGTQADGIAMASAANGYKTWRTVRGPASLPETAGGAGLPTSLINCLYVAHDGTVYAGTTTGLARSSDSGKTWRFLRGADWLDKRDGQHPQGWLDAGLVDQADVRAIEILPQNGPVIRIAAGSAGEGDWKADHDFIGGQTFHTNDAIDSSAVQNPAPQSVYQSARFGSFTYTIPGLTPGVTCRVRLHLAEVAFTKPGQRVFNVAVNGKRVLTHEDIFAEAGTKDKVIVKEFPATADAQGQLVLSFRGSQPLPSLDKHSSYELSEDYVTALAEDGAGHLLVGHRQKGVEILDPATGKHIAAKADASPATDFVTAFLPRPDGTLLIGGYGAGLSQMPIIGTTSDGVFTQTAATSAPLPAPEPPPTLAELNAMLKTVSAVAPDKSELAPKVVALDDDWLTEGDWLGRYGRYWACLCAMSYAPMNYIWGTGAQNVDYRTRLGPNHNPKDKLRYFVTTPYTTNPRSLELPPTYLDSRVRKHLTTWRMNRRQSEADDHGETYPITQEGPSVHCNLTVPAGLYVLSLYDYNKDVHGTDGNNRLRDYRISVRPLRKAKPLKDTDYFDQQPELAHSRIYDFWGGVWKRFLVRGPVVLSVQINRNHSFNTILPAITLDTIEEEPSPYFHLASQNLAATSTMSVADQLFNNLDILRLTNSHWWAENSGSYYKSLLRWYKGQPISTDAEDKRLMARLGTCYYEAALYSSWEDCENKRGLTSARQIEKQLRWDGVTDVDRDNTVVTNFLSSHPEIKAANSGDTNPLPQQKTATDQPTTKGELP